MQKVIYVSGKVPFKYAVKYVISLELIKSPVPVNDVDNLSSAMSAYAMFAMSAMSTINIMVKFL